MSILITNLRGFYSALGFQRVIPAIILSAVLLGSSFGVNLVSASPIDDNVDITMLVNTDPVFPSVFVPLANFPGVLVVLGPEGTFSWVGWFGEQFEYQIDIEEGTVDIVDLGSFGTFLPTKVEISDIQWRSQETGLPVEGSIVSVVCVDQNSGGNITAEWTSDSITIPIPGDIEPANVSCEFSAEHEDPTIDVVIDIKPGSDPNCFNNDGHGVIPIAILGSDTFDVTDIDPTSITLDSQEVKTKGNGDIQTSIEDVNGDGFDDLVVKIVDTDYTYSEGTGTATLTGELFDGTPIEGSDSICITQ